jgi:tRNA isopentenyl-2-thiomethyl-A-37 hydroxylase MiaE
MDQGAKVQLFNDQELVNTTLTRRDGDRRICESVAPMGSHIPKTVCRTYREIQAEQQHTKDYLQQTQQVNNPSSRTMGGH